MKAVAINGSPRKGGNTEILLKKVLDALESAGWETELIQVGGKNIHGCLACYKCFDRKNLKCAREDDIFNEVMGKLLTADALIFGSPTYFTDVTAELKALIDRSGLVSLANGRALRRKIGAAVVAMRRGGATHVFDTINHLFLMSGMIIPGSTYWNIGVGREKGEVLNDEEGMRNMLDLAETIAWLGNLLSSQAATTAHTS
jgi:multimeric flavodoxin WrbA